MDTRIALGLKPLELPDPSAPLRNALTLNALMGQSDLQGLQVQEAQRTLRINNAIDEALKTAGSDNDVVTALRRVSPEKAAAYQKSIYENQKTQADIAKERIQQQGALAQGFLSLPPEQQAAQYPALVTQFNSILLPNQKALENEPWNPSFAPNMKRFAMNALAQESQKDAFERAGYAQTAAPTAAPASTVAALGGQPPVASATAPMPIQSTDVDSGATVRALSAQPPIVPQPLPSQAPGAAGLPGQPAIIPPQTVTAPKTAYSPEDYRAEAKRLRGLNTPEGDKRAKDYEEEANRLDQRILQEKGIDESAAVRRESIAARQSTQKNQAQTLAGKYADDFRVEPNVKNYRTVAPLYNVLVEASKVHDAAADLNMVYAIANMFDPGSVVREGEQVNVVRAGGLPSWVQQWIGKVNGGQQIPDDVRQMFVGQGGIRLKAYQDEYAKTEQAYKDLSERNGVDFRDVIRYPGEKINTKQKGAGPRGTGSGTREDPFRINGDDGWSLVPKGQFYTAPDGSIRQKQ